MPINLVIRLKAQSVLSNFWFVLGLQGIRLEKRVTTEKRKRSDPLNHLHSVISNLFFIITGNLVFLVLLKRFYSLSHLQYVINVLLFLYDPQIYFLKSDIFPQDIISLQPSDPNVICPAGKLLSTRSNLGYAFCNQVSFSLFIRGCLFLSLFFWCR